MIPDLDGALTDRSAFFVDSVYVRPLPDMFHFSNLGHFQEHIKVYCIFDVGRKSSGPPPVSRSEHPEMVKELHSLLNRYRARGRSVPVAQVDGVND